MTTSLQMQRASGERIARRIELRAHRLMTQCWCWYRQPPLELCAHLRREVLTPAEWRALR